MRIFVSALLLLSFFSLTAQNADNIALTGKVTDKDGVPLPGATVHLKNTTHEVSTDRAGVFRFLTGQKLPVFALVTFVGYQPQEITITTQNSTVITLQESTGKLNDVVVVGYGTQRRKDLTSSISSVKQEEVASLPVASFDAQLQGKAPGLQINSNTGTPGDAAFVRIRGTMSINADNNPLYIIDGVFVNNTSLQTINTGGRSTSPLTDINPADIENVEVLKDASATAIYGSRGANGVIIVTTKRGKFNSPPRLNLDVSSGTNWAPKLWNLTTGPQHATLENEFYANSYADAVVSNNTAGIAKYATGPFTGERHHGGVPNIDPAKYELLIHGMVDRPMVFTLRDLKRFPSLSRICFLECSGNFRSGKTTMTPQEICGLTSQSEWTGVPLATLFREVGVHPSATWFLAEGSDAAVMTRSIPVHKGWDDALIAYGQNGEALRPQQGYPARLLLPGWEGNTNVKWIRRIELSDGPFMTREETSKYTYPIKGGLIGQFSFDMDARSIITFPAYPVQIDKGWVEITGLAWSGRGKISKVEISADAGKHWAPAKLMDPVLDKAHTRFTFLWSWDGKETAILSRATDETGYTQPTLAAIAAIRGKDMGGYHLNPITAWHIQKDGRVFFQPEKLPS